MMDNRSGKGLSFQALGRDQVNFAQGEATPLRLAYPD